MKNWQRKASRRRRRRARFYNRRWRYQPVVYLLGLPIWGMRAYAHMRCAMYSEIGEGKGVVDGPPAT